MKPFDLERFLAGDPVMCRDGTVPSELHYFETAHDTPYQLVGVINGTMRTWSVTGLVVHDSTHERPYDLMMAPRTVEKWVWVYPSGVVVSASLFDTKEDCASCCATLSGHPARVTWEE